MEAALKESQQTAVAQTNFGKYPQRYAGKYCLVTGGSKGIGRGICLRLAQEGGHVCIHYGEFRLAAPGWGLGVKELKLEVDGHFDYTLKA